MPRYLVTMRETVIDETQVIIEAETGGLAMDYVCEGISDKDGGDFEQFGDMTREPLETIDREALNARKVEDDDVMPGAQTPKIAICLEDGIIQGVAALDCGPVEIISYDYDIEGCEDDDDGLTRVTQADGRELECYVIHHEPIRQPGASVLPLFIPKPEKKKFTVWISGALEIEAATDSDARDIAYLKMTETPAALAINEADVKSVVPHEGS